MRADDTNSSAADFSLGTPIPRNNAATPTETLCHGHDADNTDTKKKCKKKEEEALGRLGQEEEVQEEEEEGLIPLNPFSTPGS